MYFLFNLVSHAKTNEPSLAYLEILNNFWNEEFQ